MGCVKAQKSENTLQNTMKNAFYTLVTQKLLSVKCFINRPINNIQQNCNHLNITLVKLKDAIFAHMEKYYLSSIMEKTVVALPLFGHDRYITAS